MTLPTLSAFSQKFLLTVTRDGNIFSDETHPCLTPKLIAVWSMFSRPVLLNLFRFHSPLPSIAAFTLILL